MTSYDHDENVRAVPRGAEEGRAEAAAAGERRGQRRAPAATRGTVRGGRGGARQRPAGEQPATSARPTPRRATPVTVQIDFDGIAAAHPRGAGRARARVLAAAGRRGGHGVLSSKPPAGAAARRTRWQRYRLSDRKRRAPFVTGVADYDVAPTARSCSIARAAAAAGRGARGGGAGSGRRCSSSTPIADRAHGRHGPARRHAAHVPRSEGGVQADLQRRLAQPARLPLRAEHARRRLAADEGDVRPAAAVRDAPRRPQLPARQHGRRDRDRPLVRARRRHAGGADASPAACSARTSRSRTAATRSRGSTTARAGIRSCARRSPRPASTSPSATTSSRSTASTCARPTTSIACSTAPPTGRPCSR